uniref:Uncharacterized protein n=1 Tax=Malurus cyaneus samueli TaxID=2593467 RepID=A0A8C5TJA5_9PASS
TENLICHKNQTVFVYHSSQVQWCVPVFPTTGEAETAGSPECRSSGLQCPVSGRHSQTLMLFNTISPHLPGT